MKITKQAIIIPTPNKIKGISKINFLVLVLKLFYFLILWVIYEIAKNPLNLS